MPVAFFSCMNTCQYQCAYTCTHIFKSYYLHLPRRKIYDRQIHLHAHTHTHTHTHLDTQTHLDTHAHKPTHTPPHPHTHTPTHTLSRTQTYTPETSRRQRPLAVELGRYHPRSIYLVVTGKRWQLSCTGSATPVLRTPTSAAESAETQHLHGGTDQRDWYARSLPSLLPKIYLLRHLGPRPQFAIFAFET